VVLAVNLELRPRTQKVQRAQFKSPLGGHSYFISVKEFRLNVGRLRVGKLCSKVWKTGKTASGTRNLLCGTAPTWPRLCSIFKVTPPFGSNHWLLVLARPPCRHGAMGRG